MRAMGTLVEATLVPLGDELQGTHAIGATTLQLDDVSDFSETGGEVDINGVIYEYLAVDDDLGTMTLSTPLAVEAPDESFVAVHPVAEDLRALVQIYDEQDPQECPVSVGIKDLIPEGVRDEDEQEPVLVELEGDDWTVIDVPGSSQLRDASQSYVPPGQTQRVEGNLEMIDPETGTIRQRLGDQGLGVWTSLDFNAPAPPMPDGLTLSAADNAVKVVWSGSATGAIPADFRRLAIYMDDSSGYTPTEANEVAAITSVNGGLVLVPAPAGITQYMRVAIINTSEVTSAYTTEVPVTPTAPGGGTPGITTHIQATKPDVGTSIEGDIWWESDAGNRQYRFDAVIGDYLPVAIGQKGLAFNPLGGMLGNLVRDPLFLDAEIIAGRLADTANVGAWSFVGIADAPEGVTGVGTGTVVRATIPVAVPSGNMPKIYLENEMPIISGQVLYRGAYARIVSGGATNLRVTVNQYNAAGTIVSATSGLSTQTASDGWVLFGTQTEAHKTAVRAKVFLVVQAPLTNTVVEFYEPLVAVAGWWSAGGKHRYTYSPGIFEFQTPLMEMVGYSESGQVRIRSFDPDDNSAIVSEFICSQSGMWLRRVDPLTNKTKSMVSPQLDGMYLTGYQPDSPTDGDWRASQIQIREDGWVELNSYHPDSDVRASRIAVQYAWASIDQYNAAGASIGTLQLLPDSLSAWIGGATGNHARLDIDETRTILWSPNQDNYINLTDTSVQLSGNLLLADQPYGYRYKNANQTIGSANFNAWVDIPFQLGFNLRAGMLFQNGDTFRVPQDGLYIFMAVIIGNGNANAGRRCMRLIDLNNGTPIEIGYSEQPQQPSPFTLQIAVPYYAIADTSFKVQVWCTGAAASFVIDGASQRPYFSCAKV